jgi:hypothetical protein
MTEEIVAPKQQITINAVHQVRATSEPEVFWIDNDSLIDGLSIEGTYGSRPEDDSPHNVALRKYIADHNTPIVPYAPVEEDPRIFMRTLSARQLRLGLLSANITPTQVLAVIDGLPEGVEKETAKIEWEYATEFRRTHPLIETVGAALNLTPEQIDTLWNAAAVL